VAIEHGLQLSGFMEGSNPLLKLFLNGHAAVVVFMIVSGFVVPNLLLGKQESYPQYIVRRFFQLYPAYVICCIVGYFLADYWLALVRAVPWREAAGWQSYVGSIAELEFERSVNFWPHFGLHATMLRGLVPDCRMVC
jgi:peptidoglycan/LPS O-acetylase OafA/YrhL